MGGGGEVCVGAFGGEVVVVADACAEVVHVAVWEIGDGDDGVWDAGVDEVDGELAGADGEEGGGFVAVGCAHGEAHGGAEEQCVDFTGEGFEANGVGEMEEAGAEAGEAARAVSAHFGFATVGIVVAHAEVGLRGGCGFCADEAVSTDATVTVAEACDLFFGKADLVCAVIDHDEVVSGAVHFGEGEVHLLNGTRKRAGEKGEPFIGGRVCCLIFGGVTGAFAVRCDAGMGARVVYRARLESVCTLIGTEGSNPSPSASHDIRAVLVWRGFDDGSGRWEWWWEVGEDFLWRERCSEMIEQKIDGAAFI